MENGLHHGLGSDEATQRLLSDGANELPSSKPRPLWRIGWQVVSEPMFLLLTACGGIYLLLGSPQDAAILLGSVVVVVGMSFFQERKSERALEALRDLSSPRALVLRDGVQQRIPGRNVVRGDVLLLAEGDRVPADAMLLDGQNLAADESLLTGESAAVRKLASIDQIPSFTLPDPGGDDRPWLYSGTLVVQGKGMAAVVATGKHTAIGRIGIALAGQQQEISRVQQETHRAVKTIALWSLSLVVLLALWYGITRHDWLNGILAGLTLAMGILPAEFPLVLVIFLGLGAWRIAKKQVLTRSMPAIEMLGATSVLCVDKTGTLTQNRMAVAQLLVAGETYRFDHAAAFEPDSFPEHFHQALEFAMLSSQRDPFDPMEIAIQDTGHCALAGTEHIHGGWELVEEYPLSKELLAMSRVWRSPDRENFIIAAKGAPEAIVDLCHMSEPDAMSVMHQVESLAQQGLRVLALAKSTFTQTALPPIQHDFVFDFIGLIGLADPLRPGVKDAVAECRNAGIRVIMITGDHPATAFAIACESGISCEGGIITGAQMDALDNDTLRAKADEINLFCRVSPAQKLRLVNALKAAGEIVAMTGDGVNDAPALKAAHIGIAMGGRGTDVAREAAALVLLDDDFSSIVASVRLGRRIYDNIRKAFVFAIAAHIPLAALSFLPVVLGWPLALLPVHVVFFEILMDPTCSIVFEAEAEETDVMQRPPRPTGARLFDRELLLLALNQGTVLAVLLVALHYTAQRAGLGIGQVRALSFTALIVGVVWLLFLNRSRTLPFLASLRLPNRALWSVLAGAASVLLAALAIPAVRSLFHFELPPWPAIALAAAGMTATLGLLGRMGALRGHYWFATSLRPRCAGPDCSSARPTRRP